MEISDAWVEAGALALPRPNTSWLQRSYVDGVLLDRARQQARLVIEAVAPAIRAAAMEEAAQIVEDEASSSVPRALDNDDYWWPVYRKRIAAAIRSAKEAA